MRLILCQIVLAGLFMVQTVAAAPLDPVTLEPIDYVDATLTVVDAQGQEVVYTPAALEQFTTYQLRTTTPWRDAPAVFEGVLLNDILRANGYGEDATIDIMAENDYRATFSSQVLAEVDFLVAIRVDGRPHTRRARGPIQVVVDAKLFEASELATGAHLVWMAARISPHEAAAQ